MAFRLASSPHNHSGSSTSNLMRTVILATIPGIAAQWYFFGAGNLIHIVLACLTAIITEAVFLKIRKQPILNRVKDNSALLTGLLIGISIPGFAPWWISVMGAVFAIGIAKQLYGGLGQNIFNPAMVAYVMLLVSFPLQMTTWPPVSEITGYELSLWDVFNVIFAGVTLDGHTAHQLMQNIDGITMATPLDTLKTGLAMGHTVSEIQAKEQFSWLSGLGWEWINLAFLAGGVYLLSKRAILWYIPVGLLGGLFVISFIGFLWDPDSVGSPIFHLFSGATMLGAFFIATDPVSASTTPKGRLIFGALIGLLVYAIRTWGGYPDAMAFAVLLANMCVPLIDYYTQPRVYGHK